MSAMTQITITTLATFVYNTSDGNWFYFVITIA